MIKEYRKYLTKWCEINMEQKDIYLITFKGVTDTRLMEMDKGAYLWDVSNIKRSGFMLYDEFITKQRDESINKILNL